MLSSTATSGPTQGSWNGSYSILLLCKPAWQVSVAAMSTQSICCHISPWEAGPDLPFGTEQLTLRWQVPMNSVCTAR